MSRIDDLKARYEAAMHGMQSGVAMKINFDASDTSPKHLRVGVNSALVDSGAMAGLLIKKGVITEEEYLEMLVEVAERERESYERTLTGIVGTTVRLG